MKNLKNYLLQNIKNFWNTLGIIFSNDQTLSSKRIFGAIIIIYTLVCVRIPIISSEVDLSQNELSIVTSLLLVGSLLVSGDSIKDIITHFKK